MKRRPQTVKACLLAVIAAHRMQINSKFGTMGVHFSFYIVKTYVLVMHQYSILHAS